MRIRHATAQDDLDPGRVGGDLVHDRDGAFAEVATTVAGMRIDAVRTAPRSPWQNAYVERVVGSIRRECLDHVIVVNEVGLRWVLASYVS